MTIKLVIFDLDGTLYKSESTFVPAVQNTLRDFGMPVLGKEKILPLLRFTAKGYSERLLDSADQAGIDALRKKIREYELKDIPISGELYPAMRETLEVLRKTGYEMAVCTNAEHNYLHAVLKKTGIENYFTLAFGNDSGRAKSELMAELISAAGTRPGECAVLGDSDSDQHAAEKNGITFIEAAWGYGNASIVNPAYSISDIEKLPEVLERLA